VSYNNRSSRHRHQPTQTTTRSHNRSPTPAAVDLRRRRLINQLILSPSSAGRTSTTTPRHKKPVEPHRVAVSTVLQCRRSRVVFSNPKQRYKPSAAATTKSHPPAAALAAATTTRLLALATPQQQYQQISSHASSPITTRRKLSEED